ncbi:MAG: RHS repeat-associated core domain-containing protein [Gammaproteobacteria bacterium]|nr:RHS repeat-associated core domain-containing protein [Gammaproteobacteria bacterium]
MHPLEPYCQTHTYDTSNNLTCLSHQAKSSAWQQIITLNPNNNRGTETKPSTTDFDANGNLLTLNNIGTLDWHYNNTLNKLNKLTKDGKTTEYYVYDHQGNRVRTVLESNQKIQSQRDYLPSIDISTNNNQPTNTLHIGTHILTETTKDARQTRYQLSSHLQSNTLELNDKAEVISYEHFYPYGGTAIIAGKDRTQVQQKCYRYTGKERDDSSGLSYYGARYLAPWMARWISPDSARAVDGLNLYVYVGNNPLKYIDPTGHAWVHSFDGSFRSYEINVLSLVDEIQHSDNLFRFPKAYERLGIIVRNYSNEHFNLLDAHTEFIVKSIAGVLEVKAKSTPECSEFFNTMDFSTGELTFDSNFKDKKSVINATQASAFQYLGMTKIARAPNMFPKNFVRSNISNEGVKDVIETYRQDGDYQKFIYNFSRNTDNGRSSSRIAEAFGLKVTSIELVARPLIGINSIRLHLKQQKTLRSMRNPLVLPPRKEYVPPQ